MGDEIAKGLLAMRQVCAHTFVLDESSGLVFGMPGVSIKTGAAGTKSMGIVH
ncbi:MAG: hypothetical protein WCI18_06405 [Pseudomonadota bacterium]